MRILLLAPQPFFEVRGTPLAVRALVLALLELRHEVDLLTFPQGEDLGGDDLRGVDRRDDTPLRRFRHLRSCKLPVGRVRAGASWAKLLLDVPFMLEAYGRMATGKYDVVHAVEEAAHLAAPVTRLLGLPLVVDVDSSIPDQLRYSGFARGGPLPWLAEKLEANALRHAAAVVTVCASLTEGVRARAPQARVFQIEDPPLVDPVGAGTPTAETSTLADRSTEARRSSETRPSAAQSAGTLRQRLGLAEGPVALYSGNFEPYQGVGLLVEAAARAKEVQFLFMGGEPGEIEGLRAQAAASGARCTFAGKRPPAELPEFLALADVLVSPRTQGANTPFKIFTYLASGKPLVATRLPTHTQLLDDSLALLVEPSAEGLASGMREVLARPAEAQARADAGRALIAREYSEARFREKVRAVYDEVAKIRTRGARPAPPA